MKFLAEGHLLERPNPIVNLEGANLENALLGGTDLRHAYLRNVRLLRAELGEADLRDADLTNADVEQACIARANLDRAIVDGAFFTDSYMYDVTMSGIGTRNPKYNQPKKGAPAGFKLLGVDFSSTYLGDATGKRTNLAAASFNGAYISAETRIEGADLAGAVKLPKDDNTVVDKKWGYCFAEQRIANR